MSTTSRVYQRTRSPVNWDQSSSSSSSDSDSDLASSTGSRSSSSSQSIEPRKTTPPKSKFWGGSSVSDSSDSDSPGPSPRPRSTSSSSSEGGFQFVEGEHNFASASSAPPSILPQEDLPPVIQHIQTHTEAFASSDYRDLSHLAALGVDINHPDSVQLMTQTFQKMNEEKVSYEYEPEHEIVRVLDREGQVIAYLKPGLMRVQQEAAIKKVSRALGASQNFSPVAYFALDGEKLGKVTVTQLFNVPSSGRVSRKACSIFSEQLFNGNEVHLTENTSAKPQNISRSTRVGFKGHQVMGLSPAIRSAKPFDRLSFHKFVAAAGVLGLRDMNCDAFVDEVCIDYEENGAIKDLKGRRAVLELGPLLTSANAIEDLSDGELQELDDFINRWNYTHLETLLKSARISHRHTEFESAEPDGELKRLPDGRSYYVQEGGRDPSIYPVATPESDRIFTDEQVSQMLKRARRISMAVKRALLGRSMKSEVAGDTSYSAWTSFFAADPVSGHICNQITNPKRSSTPYSTTSTGEDPVSRAASASRSAPRFSKTFTLDPGDQAAFMSELARTLGDPAIAKLDFASFVGPGRNGSSSPELSPGKNAARFLSRTRSSDSDN